MYSCFSRQDIVTLTLWNIVRIILPNNLVEVSCIAFHCFMLKTRKKLSHFSVAIPSCEFFFLYQCPSFFYMISEIHHWTSWTRTHHFASQRAVFFSINKNLKSFSYILYKMTLVSIWEFYTLLRWNMHLWKWMHFCTGENWRLIKSL